MHCQRHLTEFCDFRQYKCEFCGHTYTYINIAGSVDLSKRYIWQGKFTFWRNHYNQCPSSPMIICPNKCGVTNVKRKDLNEHQSICHLE